MSTQNGLPTTKENTPVVELSGALALGLQVLVYCFQAVGHMPLKTSSVIKGL